ncbi:hypothetical protein PG995_015025 [Apiospora arundinis]
MGNPHQKSSTISSTKVVMPIGLAEFIEALRATCKPRFPEALPTHNHRLVALAISGGVDSMALAYLCSKVREHDPMFMVCDNPVGSFRGFVVDHGLRQESAQEARDVCKALRDMGIATRAVPINWSREFGEGTDPKAMANFESAARRARYRVLGRCCASQRIATLLLGHHQDDQYETVLMRLVSGHRSRALRGMRRASEIPECDGIHNVFNSGWLDDQDAKFPISTTNLAGSRLLDENDQTDGSLVNPWVAEIEHVDEFEYLAEEGGSPYPPLDFELAPMPIEDAGVNIYRPLLDFGKDRLIATCLANDIPWWEDRTNADPTLTTRNTLRDLAKTDKLPAALRKPAVLVLSAKWEVKARARDAEVDRWLERTVLHEFEPHVGSIVVQFPDMAPPGQLWHQSARRRSSRIAQKRDIAGALVQRILALVSPDIQLPSLGKLQNVISRLFPSLAGPPEALPGTPPSHFPSHQCISRRLKQALHLSRWPSLAMNGLVVNVDALVFLRRTVLDPIDPSPPVPRRRHALPRRARQGLPGVSRPRRSQAAEHHPEKGGPGKVRYTLPAIYTEEYLDLDDAVARPDYPNPEEGEEYGPYVDAAANKRRSGSVLPIATSKMRLLALPTLDIQIPGLEKWLAYEMRYKRADRDTLHNAGTFSRGSFVAPVRLEKKVATTTHETDQFLSGSGVPLPYMIDSIWKLSRVARVKSTSGNNDGASLAALCRCTAEKEDSLV